LAKKHNLFKNKEKRVKKKLGSIKMLVTALALALLAAACENGVQEVEGNVGLNYEKANPVAAVAAEVKTLTQTPGTGSSTAYYYVFLAWDAADNVNNYSIVFQQEGKKTVQSGSLNQAPGYVFDSSGSQYNPVKPNAANDDDRDIDKYIAYGQLKTVTVSGGSTTVTSGGNFLLGKRYRFGVRTSALVTSGQTLQSDIVWSDYVQF
jgi:hypothetical protein